MSTIKCTSPRTQFLTADEVAAIFEKADVANNSDLSTDDSEYSGFWESSDTDSSNMESETEISGSLPFELSSKEEDSLTPADSGAEDGAPCSKRAKIMFEESCSEDAPSAEETGSESEFEPPPKRMKTTAEAEPRNLRAKYRQSSRRGRGRYPISFTDRSRSTYESGSGGSHKQPGQGRSGGGTQGRSGRTRGRGNRQGARSRGESSSCRGKGCKKGQHPQHAKRITEKQGNDGLSERVEFCPLRNTGPHVPLEEVNALSLFELFFDDEVLTRILNCSLSYTDDNKEKKANRYQLFMRRNITKKDIMAFFHRCPHSSWHSWC